jgi:glycosyltransferase involved in cell wall biosynthesis
MKILFVTGLTGFGLGGARTEEIRLLRGCADKGCDVAMCSDVLAGELTGIAHFKLDYPPGEQAPAQLARALAEFKPDLVHVVGGGVAFLNVCDRQITGVPWVFTAHNVPPAERIFPRLFGSATLHYTVRNTLALPNVWYWARYLKSARFHTAICHSRTVAARLKEVGCPAGKVAEIPFGSELPAEALQADPAHPSPFPQDSWPKILTVAGLAHHKGQLDGVRMAGRLLADFPKLSYLLIGMTRDKKYRAFVEREIHRLNLSQNVTILTAAPDPVKFAALRGADLYVQPSHEEGFCIAFLEGAMLVPRLIGTDTGAIAAMAQGDSSARVVKCADVARMEGAARELLGQNVAPGALEKRRDELARRYSWEAYLDAHVRTYRMVLGMKLQES